MLYCILIEQGTSQSHTRSNILNLLFSSINISELSSNNRALQFMSDEIAFSVISSVVRADKIKSAPPRHRASGKQCLSTIMVLRVISEDEEWRRRLKRLGTGRGDIECCMGSEGAVESDEMNQRCFIFSVGKYARTVVSRKLLASTVLLLI